jgi:drug/metabolite transporter (DMT)-like permease
LRTLLAINGVFYIVAGVVVAALMPPVIPMRHAPFQLGDAAWFGAAGTLVAGVGCGTWLLVAALRRKYLSSIAAICVCSFLTILLGVFVFLPYATGRVPRVGGNSGLARPSRGLNPIGCYAASR